MNQPKTVAREISVSTTKITKKEVDAALAVGNTHAKFKNKGVQKRLIKNQEKIRRQQALREQQAKRSQKERARMQQAHAVLANAGKAETVVNEGVAALGGLLGGFQQGEAQAVAAADTAPLVITPGMQGYSEDDFGDHGATKDGVEESIDPASIGGDLVDVDHDPKNFDVQHIQEAAESDAEMLKLYPPLDLGNVQSIDDLPGETISDKLENTFTGNLSDLLVNPQQQAQMDIRGHALDIDIAATYERPEVKLAVSQAEVGEYVNTPKAEQFGAPKMNPRSLSANVYDIAEPVIDPMDGVIRPDHQLDTILVEHCVASDMSEAETNRTIHGTDE